MVVEASSESVEKSVKTAFYTRPPLELSLVAYSRHRGTSPRSTRTDFAIRGPIGRTDRGKGWLPHVDSANCANILALARASVPAFEAKR